MPFHKHCPSDSLLVLREGHLYCHDGLRELKHLVNTHVYIGQFKKSLLFLVNLKCHKTDTSILRYERLFPRAKGYDMPHRPHWSGYPYW